MINFKKYLFFVLNQLFKYKDYFYILFKLCLNVFDMYVFEIFKSINCILLYFMNVILVDFVIILIIVIFWKNIIIYFVMIVLMF